MCKWKGLVMRIFCKRSVTRDSVQSTASIIYLHSSQQFSEEFKRQLTEENIRELSIVFRMIDISSQVVSKSLFRYMNRRGFRSIFKTELREYHQRSPNNTEDWRAVRIRLKTHCFAVLSIYLDMVEHLHDPIALDKFLQQIAISHCFITEPSISFEMHDFLLKQFMKQEFGKYMSKFTRRALKIYLKLISTRLKVLIEQQSVHNDFDHTVRVMELQRSGLNSKIEGFGTFKEVYVNDTPTYSSQFSLVPSQPIYPSTSKGGKLSLDKRSRS